VESIIAIERFLVLFLAVLLKAELILIQAARRGACGTALMENREKFL
jgi:nitrogen fixation/metabolism regulation signal transduction histidine kinase